MPRDIQELMAEEPPPPSPPPNNPLTREDVPPWQILQKRSLEEDDLWASFILPLLRRSVSLKQPAKANECLRTAQLFSKWNMAGMAISGQECSRCAADGGYCLAPAGDLSLEAVQAIAATGRCTNCALADDSRVPQSDKNMTYCDLMERTMWLPCCCDWWMPTEERQRYKLWADALRSIRDEQGFPGTHQAEIPESTVKWIMEEQSRFIAQCRATRQFPPLGPFLDKPLALLNFMQSFVNKLPPGTWARPSRELLLQGPCMCQEIPATSTPRWWQAVEDRVAEAAQSGDCQTEASVASLLPWNEPLPTPSWTTTPYNWERQPEEQGDLSNTEPLSPITSRQSSNFSIWGSSTELGSDQDGTPGSPSSVIDDLTIGSSKPRTASNLVPVGDRPDNACKQPETIPEEERQESAERTNLTSDVGEIETASASGLVDDRPGEETSQHTTTFTSEEGRFEHAGAAEEPPQERLLPRRPTEEY